MNAPRARRRIPTRASGFILTPIVKGDCADPSSIALLPDGSKVQAGSEKDYAGDDRPWTTVILEAERLAARTMHPPNNGQDPENDTRYAKQREEGEERTHDCLMR